MAPPLAQCADHVDNDNDGKIDFPNDPGCTSSTDDSEADPVVAPPPALCADGQDNDLDGKVDLADPGCVSATDNDETDPPPPPNPQCSDGDDNDNDGRSDFGFDPGCSSVLDNDETDPLVIGASSPALLSPFPIVRLRGRLARHGVLVNLLTVQAPAGSRVTIKCRGPRRSCPGTGTSTRPATGPRVRFRLYERALSAGTTLRIFVTKQGFLGKYTRFTIRRGAAPARIDSCARPNNTSVSCPRL